MDANCCQPPPQHLFSGSGGLAPHSLQSIKFVMFQPSSQPSANARAFSCPKSFVGDNLQRDSQSVCMCIHSFATRDSFPLFLYFFHIYFLTRRFCRKLPRSILSARPAGTYLFCSRLKGKEEKETPMPPESVYLFYI